MGQAVGRSRDTLAKAKAVVEAAEAEPERFGKLLADMDRTGRVNGVYKRLQRHPAGRADSRRAAAAAGRARIGRHRRRPAVALRVSAPKIRRTAPPTIIPA